MTYRGAPAVADVDFSPGRGIAINALLAKRVAAARRRIVICSMLFTFSRLIRALMKLLDRGDVQVAGVFDGTQMAEVLDRRRGREDVRWKQEAVNRIVFEGGRVGKNSTRFRPDAVHDFLHFNTIVVDDTVLTGSHIFSRSARANAEIVLAITSSLLAGDVDSYAQQLVERYRSPEPWSRN